MRHYIFLLTYSQFLYAVLLYSEFFMMLYFILFFVIIIKFHVISYSHVMMIVGYRWRYCRLSDSKFLYLYTISKFLKQCDQILLFQESQFFPRLTIHPIRILFLENFQIRHLFWAQNVARSVYFLFFSHFSVIYLRSYQLR